MIAITNLSYYLGDRALYDSASLHIKPKQKIGLIGLNGTGKSTLLRLIDGEYQPDEGSISKSGDCSIGFLNQDLLSYQSDDSILSVAMQAFERQNELQIQIDKILHEMEANYRDELVDKLARAQDEFDALDGYTIQSKAEAILEGLGFSTDDLHQPLRLFSGGWRMRVMLAKLLLQKPALLMLDEPTNHLDLPSIQWVEKYVQNYEGAVIVVSHDREFLDNVVDTIVEVSGAKLNLYSGNYSFYEEEKTLRNEIQRGAYENQQAKIRQTERFIERFKAKATKARRGGHTLAPVVDKIVEAHDQIGRACVGSLAIAETLELLCNELRIGAKLDAALQLRVFGLDGEGLALGGEAPERVRRRYHSIPRSQAATLDLGADRHHQNRAGR